MTPPSSRGTAIIAWFSMYSCSWWPTRYVPSMTRSPSPWRSAASPALDGVVRELVVRLRSGSNTAGSRSVRSVTWRARLAERRAVGRGDERARLRLVPDLAADRHEDRLVVLDEADDVLARDVVAVTTTTRFQSKASSSSIASRRACGSVERIVAPNQAPGKTRSSAYFAVAGQLRRALATERGRRLGATRGRVRPAG